MKTRLVVGSAFRNSAGQQVERWIDQVVKLHGDAGVLGIDVRAVAVEGDSVDSTYEQLRLHAAQLAERGIMLNVRQHHHGGRAWGSVEDPERMAALSGVGNAIVDAVDADDDYMFYVESDLIWEPLTVLSLTMRAAGTGKGFDNYSPLVFAGECFYDVWGYRGLDGSRFAPFYPYHSTLTGLHSVASGVEVGSVGSCILMQGEAARTVRTSAGALVEWCSNARARGYRMMVAPDLRVVHPA